MADYIELVGLFTLAEYNLPGVEANIGCTPRDQLNIALFKPIK
jgi:hypothetical protein